MFIAFGMDRMAVFLYGPMLNNISNIASTVFSILRSVLLTVSRADRLPEILSTGADGYRSLILDAAG